MAERISGTVFPLLHLLQVEFKIAVILCQLAGKDHAGNKQQKRRHQYAGTHDQRREARHKAGGKIFAQNRGQKHRLIMPSTAARVLKKPNGR